MSDARIIDLAGLPGVPPAGGTAAAHPAAAPAAASAGASGPTSGAGHLAATPAPTAAAHGLAAAIDAARLVCFPTDTVYGIGGRCRPATHEAIWAAKGRESDKPLQVIFPTLELLLSLTRPGPGLTTALRRLLPGPVTLVLPYPDGFDGPPAGRAPDGTPTLGVRVPPWPPAAAALAALPWPLVASSANLSGAPPVRRLEDVAPSVRAACHLLLDGGEVHGTASTVVDLSSYAATGSWNVLRDGALSRAELIDVLGPPPT